MNGKLRISGVLLLLVFLFAAIALIASATDTDEYTGSVEEAKTLLDAALSAEEGDAKAAACDSLYTYLRENPLAKGSEGLDAFSFACAKFYLGEIDVSRGTAKCGIAIRMLSAHLQTYPIPEATDGYSEFLSEYEAKLDEYYAELEEKRFELQDKAELSEYMITPIINDSFDEPGTGEFKKQNQASGGVTAFIGEDSGKDGDNVYYSISYDHTNGPRIIAEITEAEGNTYFDFDVTTFTHFPNKNIRFEHGSTTINNTTFYPTYLQITPDGDFYADSRILVENAVVPGQWTHVTLKFDRSTCYISLYVDYELIAEYYVGKRVGNEPLIFDIERIRILGSPDEVGGSISLDNCVLYQGTTMRDVNKFTKMTVDERMLYYTDVFSGFTNNVTSRKVAYDEVTKLIPLYWSGSGTSGSYLTDNAELRRAVDAYNSFDYKNLVEIYSLENLKEYKLLCDTLFAYDRVPATLEERVGSLAEIDEFILNNEGFITNNDDYKAYNQKLNSVRMEITNEQQINLFIDSVNKFYSSTGYVYVERSFNTMTEMYNSGLDFALAENENFSEFKKSIERYEEAPSVLYDELCIDNSKKFIAYMNVISLYETEEEWIENFDFLESYVNAARSLMSSPDFDPYYSDTQQWIKAFEPINKFFYDKLLDVHKAFISAKLEEYDSAESYIVRFGICENVKKYVLDNSLDLTDSELSEMISIFDGYIEALKSDKDEYYALLEANTEAFVALIDELHLCETYKEKSECIALASQYYSTLNAESDIALEAVLYYEQILAEIEEAKAIAEEFKSYVMMLSSNGSQVLAGLVSCKLLLPSVEMDIEGMEDAVKEFNRVYEGYNEKIGDTNSDVNEINRLISVLANTAKG